MIVYAKWLFLDEVLRVKPSKTIGNENNVFNSGHWIVYSMNQTEFVGKFIYLFIQIRSTSGYNELCIKTDISGFNWKSNASRTILSNILAEMDN